MGFETLSRGMAATPEKAETGTSRRQAANQLGGSGRSQLYRDTKLGYPVVLRQKDGWGSIGKREYLKRTWYVQRVRCYLADSGCEVETISQSTKLERMENGRYVNLSDEEAEQVLDEATDENRKWWKANSPHIPYAEDGGVNVYFDGAYLEHKLNTDENAVDVGDDWPEPSIRVRVSYTEQGLRSIGATIDGKTIPCKRVDAEGAKAAFEAEPGDYDFRIELRVDSDYTEPHA